MKLDNRITIVLRAEDLEKTRQIYEKLGISFEFEKHGNGPEHFSSVLTNVTLEIYPGREKTNNNDWKEAGQVNLFINVDRSCDISNLDDCDVIRPMQINEETGVQSIVVKDPDDRAVHISQELIMNRNLDI